MTLPRVTALDLATTSGMAFGRLGEVPTLTHRRFGTPKSSLGARGLDLMGWLRDHLDTFRPDIVFIEEPLTARVLAEIGATIHTSIMLPGFVAIAATVCASRQVPYELAPRQAVLHHFTGRSRFPKKGEAKKAVFTRAVQLRWKPETEDEADAAATWDYGAAKTNPRSFVNLAAERPATMFS